MTTPFVLDPRLSASSHHLGTVEGFDLRLAADSRWPWILIVPMSAGVEEITDLSPRDLAAIIRLAGEVAHVLKRLHPGTGTNVATLGNVVRQFHLHVVARRPGDPNWPGPVWGHGEPAPYADPDAAVTSLRRALTALPGFEPS